MTTTPQAIAIRSPESSLLEVIERAVRDPSVDIDKMERLMAMMERQQMRRAETAYDDAMNLAQDEMRPISKDAANPQTHSRYASYGALDNAIRPIYTKNGFSLSFSSAMAGESLICVTCKVAHKAGYSERPTLSIPIDTKGPQGKDVMTRTHATMSAVTYAKRGLLKMIFNIAEGDRSLDDDGNAAGGRGFQGPTGNITAEQEAVLLKMMTDNGLDVLVFLKWAKIERLGDLPADQYGKAYNGLQAKIAEKAKKK